MAEAHRISCGIFDLPTEILLQTLNLFPTRELIQFAPTCRCFHAAILRLLGHRLQKATKLATSALYLECHHPSARLTASTILCVPLGTDGLDELMWENENSAKCIGQMEKCGKLFSRFQPQRRESPFRLVNWRVSGDIPGSRTFVDQNALSEAVEPDSGVSTTVTIEAHELFSQLSASAFLGQYERVRGLLSSTHDVSGGTIRVWRHWLAKQCESKRWTDGEPITIHRGPANSNPNGGETRESDVGKLDPLKDPGVLWINTLRENVGVKFRVKERQWRRAGPILYSSDEEVAVSYEVEFEEVLVRTTRLLLALEDAEERIVSQAGKAIIFRSFVI